MLIFYITHISDKIKYNDDSAHPIYYINVIPINFIPYIKVDNNILYYYYHQYYLYTIDSLLTPLDLSSIFLNDY